jgi:hypothetical protein
MTDEKTEGGRVTRLSFIKASAGVAAGVAAAGVPAAAALSHEEGREIPKPASPAPQEPVMAYVHDAQRGEITVMSGTEEVTYRDRVLVKRLMAAAPQTQVENGGGIDVVAP